MSRTGWDTSVGKAPKFAEGRTTSETLPSRNLVNAYVLRLTGALTITTSTGTTTLRPDAVGRIFEAITIKSGGILIQDWRGVMVQDLEALLELAPTPQVLPANGANQAGTNIDLTLRLPCYEPRSYSRNEKLMPAALLSDLVMSVKWGALTEMFADGFNGTVSLANANVELYEETLIGVAAPERRFLPLVYSYSSEIITTQKGKSIDLDSIQFGTDVSRVLIRAEKGGANGGGYEVADDVVGAVTFRMNEVDEVNGIPWVVLQREDAREFGLSAIRSGVVLLDAVRNQRSEPFGVEPQQWTHTQGKPRLILDVTKQTGDCRVQVLALARRAAR